MRSTWTDSRLDDLKDTVGGIDEKVDEGFARIDERFVRLDEKFEERFARFDKKIDERFVRFDKKVDDGFVRLDTKIDTGLGRIDDRIDKLHHAMIAALVTLISIIAVLLAAFLTVAVTHL